MTDRGTFNGRAINDMSREELLEFVDYIAAFLGMELCANFAQELLPDFKDRH